jgi:Tol biopolymer transport system component
VKDAQHAGAAAPAMLFERLTVQGGEEQYPKISPDGTFIVYQAEDGSDADIFFQRVAGGRAINLTESSPEDDWAPAISPDGQRIAFNSDRGDGGLFVMGATGESVRRVADALNNPCWAPDGKRVVASTAGFGSPLARGVKGDLWFVDVDSGEKQQLTHDTDAVQPDWSPHGHRVAYWGIQDITGGQRDLWTVGVESGDIVPVTADSPVDWCPVWAPDGGHLYFLSDRAGSFNVWRVAVDERSGAVTGTPEPVAAPAENVGAFDISGDGTRIVYPARAARANIFRADFDPEGRVAARESQVTRGTLIITDFNVSPDGEWFVYRGGTSREDLYLSRSDGTETRKLTDDRYRDRGPKWAPDGNKVYFYSDRSGRYEYWSIRPDGSDLQQISKTEGNSWWYPNPSPDGGRLLGHNETGTSILDIARVPVGMAEATLLPNVDDNTIPRMTAWSPDGSHLAGCAIDRHEEDVPGLLVYSFESDSYRRLATSLTDINQSVYWLGDGRRVMAISGGKLVRVDTENGEVRELLDVGFGTFGLCVRADAKAYFIRFETEADIWMATQE